jgi:protein TIF31
LPKRTPVEDYSSFTLYPQSHETIQELKLAVNEWVGGYWLGPYALRLPKTSKANGTATAEEAGKEGPSVKEGESLSEYLEVAEVFAGFEGERILEVVKGGSSSLYHERL